MIEVHVMIHAETLGLSVHHQDPTFVNAYCQATTDLIN